MKKQIDCIYRKANWKLISEVESIVLWEKHYCIVWNLGIAYFGTAKELKPVKNPMWEMLHQFKYGYGNK